MLTATINACGHTTSSLADALRQALKQIEEGFTSGGNSGDTSGYRISVDGEEIDKYSLARAGNPADIAPDRYDYLEQASAAAKDGDIIVGLNDRDKVIWNNQPS